MAGNSDDAATVLSPGSPDLGAVLLGVHDKRLAGTATAQENALYDNYLAHAAWQTADASDPRRDGSAFGLGDNLFGALFTLGLGATGGLAAAPLAAGGAVPGPRRSAAWARSPAWPARVPVCSGRRRIRSGCNGLGMGLGAAGGIAGGLGGLSNLWSSGIGSLGDAARLASNAGRVVGGIGTLSDSDVLRQAGGYLGAAGQLGAGAQTISDVFGSGVSNLTDAARLASGLGQVGSAVGRVTGNRPLQQVSGLLGMGSRLGGGVGNLLGAAGQAQQPRHAARRSGATDDERYRLAEPAVATWAVATERYTGAVEPLRAKQWRSGGS